MVSIGKTRRCSCPKGRESIHPSRPSVRATTGSHFPTPSEPLSPWEVLGDHLSVEALATVDVLTAVLVTVLLAVLAIFANTSLGL